MNLHRGIGRFFNGIALLLSIAWTNIAAAPARALILFKRQCWKIEGTDAAKFLDPSSITYFAK